MQTGLLLDAVRALQGCAEELHLSSKGRWAMIGQRPAKQPKRIPARNEAIVKRRSGGVCESCGARPATNVHHRKYLSRGGTHDVHNLFDLCGMGNVKGCHGRAHKDGEREGLAIGRSYRSELVPVLYRGRWATLDDDGGVEFITESTAQVLFNGGSR